MSRSPLAYPLVRGVDADIGGAADLQTDVMRFMAILALCLVAIFALVQSIPLAPETPEPAAQQAAAEKRPAPAAPEAPPPAEPEPVETMLQSMPGPAVIAPATLAADDREPAESPAATINVETVTTPPAPPAPDGFTLRFESDLALTRLVAAGQVGFYALSPGRVKRMNVRASRVSFWDASQPGRFHEMERTTVPEPVVEALRRTGVDTSQVSWGVTLPGRLSQELEAITREHTGGSLVIGAEGTLRREAS